MLPPRESVIATMRTMEPGAGYSVLYSGNGPLNTFYRVAFTSKGNPLRRNDELQESIAEIPKYPPMTELSLSKRRSLLKLW